MNAVWRQQAARINALSLRERGLLFVSVIVGCLALGDALWLSPANERHQQLIQQFEKQNAELMSIHAGSKVDGNQAARDELATNKIELARTGRAIEAVLPSASQRTPLEQVLVHLLRRHDKLTLLRTAMANRQSATAVIGAGHAAEMAALPLGLTTQGIELTLAGSYPELVRYLKTLEAELPYVRWGVMNLKSERLPPQLTLQLFLVGVSP